MPSAGVPPKVAEYRAPVPSISDAASDWTTAILRWVSTHAAIAAMSASVRLARLIAYHAPGFTARIASMLAASVASPLSRRPM